jgi:subtilisin family serine protease
MKQINILVLLTCVVVGSLLFALARNVYSNEPITITNTGSTVPIEEPEPPVEYPIGDSLAPTTAQSSVLINMDDFRADARFSGIDGTGYTVVILDTGIDLNHPYFGPDSDNNGVADRIVYQYDFADSDSNASDVNGHGSNVSSIVGSSDGTNTGMAPGANLIHLKVFTNAGGGNFGYLEDALTWIVNNEDTYNIVSVNMSLSDSQNHSSVQALYGISDELAALEALGVVTVSAAGNSFYNFSSVQGVGYPAADANSLAVGSVYDVNIGQINYSSGAIAYTTAPDRVSPFSQRHTSLLDVMAPGAAITGAGPTGGLTTMHGTSQASPHIAGIIALMQQLADQELGRRLTIAEIKSLLETTAVIVNDGDDENDNVINTNADFPRVDMLALAEGILDMVPTATPTHTPTSTNTPVPPTNTPTPTITYTATPESCPVQWTASLVANVGQAWVTGLYDNDGSNYAVLFYNMTDDPGEVSPIGFATMIEDTGGVYACPGIGNTTLTLTIANVGDTVRVRHQDGTFADTIVQEPDTPTSTPTPTPSNTPTSTVGPTVTNTPTSTSTAVPPTATATNTPTLTPTATATPENSIYLPVIIKGND